ncbi:hypothetical protein CVT24_004064 [Panaeolus cyanescens]|uniref:RapZ C-terminal domain-containing protein n=1 Tax=Panaeolus cyanescens TaxID=181874 RepID=A0A409Y5S2_9AGAR|nr:hypothetical protein CVT24_004064 [Panaeolus cyanescens]
MFDNNEMIDSDNDLPKNNNHDAPQKEYTGVIFLTSYSHRRGPLVPTPDLSFDLRTLPNPPKNVRASQTGVHTQLREWLFANPDVRTRFDSIYRQISERVQEATTAGAKELHVGVFCQMGKHRSVTFVEELGRQRFDNWCTVINHRDLHAKRSDLGHRRGNSKQAAFFDTES